MVKKPPLRRKVVATVTAASLLVSMSFPVRANIANEMTNLVRDIGEAHVNDTRAVVRGLRNLPQDVADGITDGAIGEGPSYFRGQSYNTFVGGRVYQRFPTRNLQFMNVEMPRFSAGCGGIDVYLGSISHLRADQLVQFLRATAMGAVGVITQVALGAITPLLASKLEWAKDVMDKINSLNVNSCEAAQHLVSGAAGITNSFGGNDCVQRRMIYEGMDINEARSECDTTAKMDTARTNAPDQPPPFTGNLVWEALKRSMPGTHRQERELIMSLVGTKLYPPNKPLAEATAPLARAPADPDKTTIQTTAREIAPAHIELEQILRGTQDSANPDQVSVTMLVCDEEDRCMAPTETAVSIPSYSYRVAQLMYGVADAIRTHSDLTQDQLNFINQANLPVYSMMSVGTELQNSSMAELLVETYRDVIAADYAFAMLARNLAAGYKALRTSFSLDTHQQEDQAKIIAAARATMHQLQGQRDQALNKVADINAITKALQELQRTMASNMPAHVMNMTAPGGHGPTGKK
jgi:conjugative transfer pilus assembly protein TraH